MGIKSSRTAYAGTVRSPRRAAVVRWIGEFVPTRGPFRLHRNNPPHDHLHINQDRAE